MEDNIFIKVGSYLLTAAIGAALWIWRTAASRSKKESNINNAIEALKTEVTNNKHYLEEKIIRLERDLREQKEEKKELENKIYLKIASVEGLVTKSNEDLNHIKMLVTKIATIQGTETSNL